MIALCIGGMAIMLLIKMAPPSHLEAENGYEDVTHVFEAAQKLDSDWATSIAKAIQRADRANLRRQYEDALTQLYQVRDALQTPPKGADPDFIKNTSGYVKNRISAIRR
jgi:hypothetical protein